MQLRRFLARPQCPPNAQVGLITLRANHEGNPELPARHGADLQRRPRHRGSRPLRLHRADPRPPDRDPGHAPRPTDYGLRFTVAGITQLARWQRRHRLLGFPGGRSHDAQRFPKGSPGSPAGLPGLADTSCIADTGSPPASRSAPDRQSVASAARRLETTLRRRDLPGPGSRPRRVLLPAGRRMRPPDLQSVGPGQADHRGGRFPLRARPRRQSAAAAGLRHLALADPRRQPGLPKLTINPDAADGQAPAPTRRPSIGVEAPAHCPDNAKIGTIVISSTALPGDLTARSTSANRSPGPVPAAHLRRRLRHPREADRGPAARSGTGQLTRLRGPAAAAVRLLRLPPLRLRPRCPGDADPLHDPQRKPSSSPGTTIADETSSFGSRSKPAPAASCCPGARPFDPRLVAGTSNPQAGDFSAFTLKLDRDDGDQYLGNLNFTMPPGLTGSLRGITYCPEAAIAAAAVSSGRAELAPPSCPSTSLIGTTNVAAGPGSHPFHAVGRIYLAGPFKGAPLSLVAITPALAGPYDYGVVVVRVAIPSTPSTPMSSPTPTPCRASSAAFRSGCARSRSTSTGRAS